MRSTCLTLISALASALVATTSLLQPNVLREPIWSLVRPSNTGIPGEEIRFVRFDANGTLWVGARWPFWQEGGVGIYDRNVRVWTVYANFETPIPSEYVNDIAFGPGGVVWIATDDGLVRKEGRSWIVYDASNSPLLHNVIRDIALDSQGHVWINNSNVQNQTAAIFEFDGTNWQSFSVPGDIPWQDPWRSLSTVYVDSNDHVWVGNMTLSGVAEYDGSIWTIHGQSVAQFDFITSDLAGYIWLIEGGLGYNFYRFNGTNFVQYNSGNTPFQNTTVTTMGIDDTGALFVGNWVGQVIRTTNSGTSWSLFATVSSIVMDIAPDPESGEVWVGSLGALHHLSSTGASLEILNTYNSGMPWYWVDNMYADRDGNFWVATGEAGASRFDGLRWRNWGAHNAGSEPWPFLAEQAFGLYMDLAGDMWIGSNGVGRWDPETETLEIWDWRNTPIFGVTIFRYFAQDMNGTLFAVEDYGSTFRFDYGTETWSQEPVQPYAPLGLPGVDTDSQGNVWIAGWFALHKWDGSSWQTVGEDWGLFDLGGVNALAVGPDDTIWLGINEGLLHVEGDVLTLYDTTNSPLPAPEVQSIAFREDGLMALSAHEFNSTPPFPNGVAVIHGDIDSAANWTIYRYEDGVLPHYQLGKVAFDPWGRLWVSALSEAAAVYSPLPIIRRAPPAAK